MPHRIGHISGAGGLLNQLDLTNQTGADALALGNQINSVKQQTGTGNVVHTPIVELLGNALRGFQAGQADVTPVRAEIPENTESIIAKNLLGLFGVAQAGAEEGTNLLTDITGPRDIREPVLGEPGQADLGAVDSALFRQNQLPSDNLLDALTQPVGDQVTPITGLGLGSEPVEQQALLSEIIDNPKITSELLGSGNVQDVLGIGTEEAPGLNIGGAAGALLRGLETGAGAVVNKASDVIEGLRNIDFSSPENQVLFGNLAAALDPLGPAGRIGENFVAQGRSDLAAETNQSILNSLGEGFGLTDIPSLEGLDIATQQGVIDNFFGRIGLGLQQSRLDATSQTAFDTPPKLTTITNADGTTTQSFVGIAGGQPFSVAIGPPISTSARPTETNITSVLAGKFMQRAFTDALARNPNEDVATLITSFQGPDGLIQPSVVRGLLSPENAKLYDQDKIRLAQANTGIELAEIGAQLGIDTKEIVEQEATTPTTPVKNRISQSRETPQQAAQRFLKSIRKK